MTTDRLEEALSAYWDCAYQEGHLRRPDGDNANKILHEIREAVEAERAEEREACIEHVLLELDGNGQAEAIILAIRARGKS